MSLPTYYNIGNDKIHEIEFDGWYLRLLAGEYGEYKGHQGEHLPLNYYDIHLNENEEFTLEMKEDDSVMVFTLLRDAVVAGEDINEKTAVKLTDGTSLTLKGKEGGSQILYMQSRELNEPIAWAGPIVMNSRAELEEAFGELENGTFIKEKLDIE